MRLTCPNCGAQYEIPDEVIPETGRDVQCSNCAITWFQAHPDFPIDPPEAPEPEPVWEEPAPERASEPEPAPEPEQAPEPAPAPAPDAPQGDDSPPPPPEPTAPVRRTLDPEVSDVLRQEAEREARVRAQEASSIETQADLGLEDVEDPEMVRARQAQARMARLRGLPDTDPVDEGPEPEVDPGPRRNLLPDIDEINSSLESSNGPKHTAAAEPDVTAGGDVVRSSGGGFRMGFWVMVLIAVLAVALYVMAPTIAELAPPLRTPLESYVEMVNAGRLWLDDKVSGLMGQLDSMSSDAATDEAMPDPAPATPPDG